MTPETRAEIEKAAKELNRVHYKPVTGIEFGYIKGYIPAYESFAADREKLNKAMELLKRTDSILFLEEEHELRNEIINLLNTLKK